MKGKIVGILVIILLIAATVLPATGNINIKKTFNDEENVRAKEVLNSQQNEFQDNDWLPQGASNTDPIYHTGDVGIGTTNPQYKLHIGGKSLFEDYMRIRYGSDPTYGTRIIFEDNSANQIAMIDVWAQGLAMRSYLDDKSLTLMTKSSTDTYPVQRVTVTGNGNVGINTTSPKYLLDISGGSGIVAQFSGRVKGLDAVNDDEFVTKKQVKSVAVSYYTPIGTSDTNGNIGDTAWDSNYFYVKTPDGWKRSALETWESSVQLIN